MGFQEGLGFGTFPAALAAGAAVVGAFCHSILLSRRGAPLFLTLFGLASVFLCHFANPPISAWLAGLLASGAAVPLSLILLAVYLTDIVRGRWGR